MPAAVVTDESELIGIRAHFGQRAAGPLDRTQRARARKVYLSLRDKFYKSAIEGMTSCRLGN